MVPVGVPVVAFDPAFADSSYSDSSYVAASSFAAGAAVASFAASSLAGASRSTVVVDQMAAPGDLARADELGVGVAVELPPVASSDHASSVASTAPYVAALPFQAREQMGPVSCPVQSGHCYRLNLVSSPMRFDCRCRLAVSVVDDAGAVEGVRPFAILPALAGIVMSA